MAVAPCTGKPLAAWDRAEPERPARGVPASKAPTIVSFQSMIHRPREGEGTPWDGPRSRATRRSNVPPAIPPAEVLLPCSSDPEAPPGSSRLPRTWATPVGDA
jgi:hypothetical protein